MRSRNKNKKISLPRHFQVPRVQKIEKYLGIEDGSFEHIPHYARDSALLAINNVKRMEKRRLFREGLYYIVLSDLCRSTKTSESLGSVLNKRRVETFILSSIEALGQFDPKNYILPVREVGDAVLVLFSSFDDVHHWWCVANSLMDARNRMWEQQLEPKEFKDFYLESKTVVHCGEVSYSDGKVPVAQAINEVFKVEKSFKANELGATQIARLSAAPVIKDLTLKVKRRGSARLPGATSDTPLFVLAKYIK